MDPFPVLIIAVKILILVLAVKTARRKHRSGLVWFFICLFFSVLGFLILLVLPPMKYSCPVCGAEYKEGQQSCSKCNSALPDKYATESLALNKRNTTYALKCSNCEMPYRIEDYDKNANRIFCSRCKSELPMNVEG